MRWRKPASCSACWPSTSTPPPPWTAGRGKRGSVRTLVATNKGNRWFFVFGFDKNERANISDEELEGLQAIAADLLARTGPQLDEAVADGALQEICQ
ncbi:MAG: type II toxin-antitoxin system RelE/ParE family toxin [Achromobacter sp.]|nr:type II toxin-antitoxin system RelE/ParE family toxin [Achromobacter sp.]